MKTQLLASAIAVTTILSASLATAQVQDQQVFRVHVLQNLTITAPNKLVEINHDETDADQAFPPQQWVVKANTPRGATVTFSTNRPFTNESDGNYKRDAKLDLSIASASAPARWKVTVPSDTTSYQTSKKVATVQAASRDPGAATFNVNVTFVTNQWDTLAFGDYSLTVTGTLTAN